MEKLQIGRALLTRGITGLFVVLFLLGAVMNASAQRGRGGPQLSPEKQAAVEEIEAEYVAKKLELSGDATVKLVESYQKARTSLRGAFEKLGDSRDFQAYRELIESERGKLEAGLKGFLNEDQAGKAIESLGTFSSSWDRMVDTLSGFKLDEKKLYEALGKVDDYLAESTKLSREAREAGDFQAMRPKLQELREKLNEALKPLLSAEQLTQWTEATARRRRN